MSQTPEIGSIPTDRQESPLSRALHIACSEKVLSHEENVQLGESIVELRNLLGPSFSKIRKPDDNYQIPVELKGSFSSYRNKVNELVSGNLRLIAVVYKKHPGLTVLPEQQQEDLIADAWGNSLITCAERYNPWFSLKPGEVKYKDRQPSFFSSYAINSMWFGMLNTMKRFYDPPMTETRWNQYINFLEARGYYKKMSDSFEFNSIVAVAELIKRGKQNPSQTEIIEYLNFMDGSDDRRRKFNKLTHKYINTMNITEPVSFEELFLGNKQYREEQGGELVRGEYSISDILPSVSNTENEVMINILHDDLKQIMEHVFRNDPRTKQMLEMHFSSDTQYTYDQIGQYFGITKERVRQLITKGLRRLRNPYFGRKLRVYLDADKDHR